MRNPKVGPPVPVGYINVEEWGEQTGREKVAAYAAVKRGEVEVEDYGVMCIREDWRERNAARAAAEAAERRRRYLEKRSNRECGVFSDTETSRLEALDPADLAAILYQTIEVLLDRGVYDQVLRDPQQCGGHQPSMTGGKPHVSQRTETSMGEKIIPKDSIPEPPRPTWQPDPAGGWEKDGVWVVPIEDSMWGVRWAIDDGPLWGTRAAAMLSYNTWSAPFGAFDTAEAAMQAVDDGYDGAPEGYWEDEPR
jgi:hypothetical protein